MSARRAVRKDLSGNPRIRSAQVDRERWVLRMIRKYDYYAPVLPGVAIGNAIDRLLALGRIRLAYERRSDAKVVRVRSYNDLPRTRRGFAFLGYAIGGAK